MIDLQRPNFVVRSKLGTLKQLYCKCCGRLIAEQRGRSFWRAKEYAEIKISFADTTSHVMSICRFCIPIVHKDPEALLQLYHAEIDDMVNELVVAEIFRYDKQSPRVTAVDTQARGIR